MPRQVRNFWIEAEIDGQKTTLSGGPKSRTGGIEVFIKMRDKGRVDTPITIRGFAHEDGRLALYVYGPDNQVIPVYKER